MYHSREPSATVSNQRARKYAMSVVESLKSKTTAGPGSEVYSKIQPREISLFQACGPLERRDDSFGPYFTAHHSIAHSLPPRSGVCNGNGGGGGLLAPPERGRARPLRRLVRSTHGRLRPRHPRPHPPRRPRPRGPRRPCTFACRLPPPPPSSTPRLSDETKFLLLLKLTGS
jgi:hypothetical protein